jgi:ribonucleoside-diphosphate reductase alpha chain
MVADLKYFDGNLARIDRVPAELRRLYATAFEIDPIWIVEAGASRQKWIDQSQSLNIYIGQASGKKLDECYKLAWQRGLKTTYYLRAVGATHAEKSTVKAGQLNSVPAEGIASSVGAGATDATGALGRAGEAEISFCKIDDPECEACQ